jgi:hypothetical protein
MLRLQREFGDVSERLKRRVLWIWHFNGAWCVGVCIVKACIRQDMIYAFLTAEDTNTQFARECLRCLALFSFLSKVHTGMLWGCMTP